MADTRKYVQAQTFTLAGAGAVVGATSITLSSFNDIDGTPLAMTDFGSLGQGTLDPGNGESEEAITWASVLQNANGTCTLGTVKNQLFKEPYTQTAGLAKTHLGGAKLIITNTAGFYSNFPNQGNDETITGLWDFPNNGNTPTLGAIYNAPTLPTQVASKAYVDAVSGGGVLQNSVILAQTAGETLVAGNACYFKQSDQRWWKADADTFLTSGNVHLGIAQGAATAGASVSILLYGMDFTQTGLTPGSFYNLSSTAGAITVALQPIYRFVGTAVTATSFMFTPYDTDSALIPGVSGEALPTGTWVYFKTSDQKWWKTDADASATTINVQVGIVQTTTTGADQLVTVRLRGVDYTQTALTPGSTYYLSGTAGAIATTTGAVSRSVGVALAAQQFLMVVSDNAYLIDQNSAQIYAASTTGNDTYVATLAPAPTAYVTGMVVYIKPDTANTGAATLNLNGLGAKSILRTNTTALQDGDIAASSIVQLAYDGTQFLMLSPYINTVTYKNGTTSKDASDASTTQNIAHGLGRVPKYARLTAYSAALTNGWSGIATSVYNGATNSSVSTYNTGASAAAAATTFTLNTSLTAGTQAGVVTFDATNIIITWTKSSSPTGTYQILWEAQA